LPLPACFLSPPGWCCAGRRAARPFIFYLPVFHCTSSKNLFSPASRRDPLPALRAAKVGVFSKLPSGWPNFFWRPLRGFPSSALRGGRGSRYSPVRSGPSGPPPA